MRVAIVSDVHGNRTAFEAVLADLRQASPDLVFHGGDLAGPGSSPVEIVDQIRDLGWPGVIGNADEMLAAPETLEAFASRTPAMLPLMPLIREMAAFTIAELGEERVAWLGALPMAQLHELFALVHASPDDAWRSPGHDAADTELKAAYSPLGRPVVVYGHIHHAFVRRTGGLTVANSGSVSMSYDGDPRAAYLLLDDSEPSIRRVEYDVERERKLLAECGLPHSDWLAKSLATAAYVAP